MRLLQEPQDAAARRLLHHMVMTSNGILMAPGTLAKALHERSRLATAEGALVPIEVSLNTIDDGGVRFQVRQASALKQKEAARSSGDARDPFLPCDPGLLVAQVSDTHVALLNKFAVLEGHLLLVTRHYEDQELLLTSDDWCALAACMAEFDGFAFYNGGKGAGASQAHKHLQLVPIASLAAGTQLPVETLFAPIRGECGACSMPGLPFRHAFVWLDADCFADSLLAAQTLHGHYQVLLERAGIRGIAAAAGDRQSGPYNLLLTREWMLLVPRLCESYCGISVNGLGFAGSLFVADAAGMEAVRKTGPMKLLAAVSLTAE